MKVTLLLPWLGNFPSYLRPFQDRLHASSPLVTVRVFTPAWAVLRARLKAITGVKAPHQIAPRKLCDYRPAFGEIFQDDLHDADWWGWCDMDCVFGDLPGFLTADRLRHYDLITDHPEIVNGPFTIMRNNERMRELYRSHASFRAVFASEAHIAWDEVGFTKLVRGDPTVNRLHLEGVHDHDRRPDAHPPRLDGKKLFSHDGHEIMTYHFPGRKAWPLD